MNTATAKLRQSGFRQKEVASELKVSVYHLREVMSGRRQSKSLLEKVDKLIKK